MDTDKVPVRLYQEGLTLRNDVAAAELITAFNEAGIESILLKGPSIARWLYNQNERRNYGDVDLLASPDEFEAAAKVVKRLGFRHLKLGGRLEEADRVRPWFRKEDGVVLELHRGFVGVSASHQKFWDELSKDSEALPLGVMGATARVPRVAARALLLGVHAANEGGLGHRLRDLELALGQLSDDVWADAASLAQKLGAEPAFAVGLSLAPDGVKLLQRLGVSPSIPPEVLLNASLPPPTAKGWERFANARGLGGKLGFFLDKLAPTPDFIRLVEPLGRRGGIWIAVAYLLRPLRLAKQAPRGFRAWRRIRRLAATQSENLGNPRSGG